MLVDDFAQKTQGRIAEMRAVLARLREANKEATRQLTKISKQHAADRARLYDRLGSLADDVVDKLPESASDTDGDRALAIQEQINDLASDVEEITLANGAIEDLSGLCGDAINDVYASLKEADAQIVALARIGTKLGV